MEALGLSVTEASEKLLITRPNLSTILNGKAGISPLMAIKLAKAFNTTPHYWLNLQTSYDLWKAYEENQAIANKVETLV
jgi:addiction module HigA family antidote